MAYIDKICHSEFYIPQKVLCECGWNNKKPSKANEPVARCVKCGKLIDSKARFAENVRKAMKGVKVDVHEKSRQKKQ